MSKVNMVMDGHLGGYIRGGDPGTWCPNLWSWIVKELDVHSVLDVGCGEGHATKFFRDLGCAALGIDGCAQAIADSAIPACVKRHDFRNGPFVTRQPVDLVWSCEFLEHVEREYLPNILATFAQARKAILITHAFPGQEDGYHHVNCQPSSYWLRRIEPLGFICQPPLTRAARTVTLADYHGINHFARSGLVFVRGATAAPATWLDRLRRHLDASWKAWKIHYGFQWSRACRQQRRRRKQMKRTRETHGQMHD